MPAVISTPGQLNRFLMQLAGTFVPILEIRSGSQVSDINTYNHKPGQEIFIGVSTKHSLISYLRRETYHQLKSKSFTMLFIHFILKHSLTQFKKFLLMTLF